MISVLAVFLLICGGALAGPDQSPRPPLRPDITANAPAGAGGVVSDPASAAPAPVQTVPRPQRRPRKLERLAAEKTRVEAQLRARGAICGDPDILGETVGRVTSGVSGCGIPEAVRVRSVAGVSLSPSAVMDCRTAQTLRHWVTVSAIPRVAAEGGADLVNLRIIGHYACRPRNNRPGARISEHGKGRAIDIAEFRLRDGSVISVKNDWNSKKGFRPLREMHRDACGIFGTVLGPQSDRFHQDHFHLDTARHFNGPYCR